MTDTTTAQTITTPADKGLRAKKVKGSDVRPPAEIREKTKERRAWLVDKLAEILSANAGHEFPIVEARIVGNGSYQSVSVWNITYTAGRTRHQGVCQYCGAEQVTEAGYLVHHGYNRPGWGYIVNVCPGAKLLALQLEKSDTERFLSNALESLPRLERQAAALKDAAEVALKAAQSECRAKGMGANTEWAIYNVNLKRPSAPRSFHRGNMTVGEAAAAHDRKLAEWKATFPMVDAYNVALTAANEAAAEVTGCQHRIEHFRRLLASGIHGTALKVEVVA
jgi:hypothetical protein